MRRRRAAKRRRGTVLLLVLVLLTLSALIAVRLASNGYRIAAEALERERAAVARWTELSCRYTLLNQATQILVTDEARNEDATEEPPRAIASYSAQFELNGQLCSVTLADEQAKVDMAVLAHLLEPNAAAERIRELAGATGLVLRGPATGSTRVPANPSWEQWFQYDGRRGPPVASFRSLSRTLTCWGRGQLHVQVADPKLLRALCRDVLDDDALARLAKAIAERPDATLNDYFRAAQLSERETEKLHSRLTDGTTRHSLWFTGGDTGDPSGSFTVAAREAGANPIHAHFRW